MTTDQRFWDKAAAKYTKAPIGDRESYEEKLRMTREFLKPGMRVLEFGCGTGETAISHAPFVEHILATDLSENMLKYGREKAIVAGVENITFQHSSIEGFEAEDAVFDAVLGLNILHLVSDPKSVIENVYRMLKPGGVFVQSTACMKGNMIIGVMLPVMRMLGKAPEVAMMTYDELKAITTGAGFDIQREYHPDGFAAANFVITTK